MLVAILLVSGRAGGSGLGWHLCSGCAKSVKCEEWVTFLYEKMNVMIGVSDVGNHERV